MKIKLLPFDEAVEKAKENGFAHTISICEIRKDVWDVSRKRTFEAKEEYETFNICNSIYIPKCCCEVIEE